RVTNPIILDGVIFTYLLANAWVWVRTLCRVPDVSLNRAAKVSAAALSQNMCHPELGVGLSTRRCSEPPGDVRERSSTFLSALPAKLDHDCDKMRQYKTVSAPKWDKKERLFRFGEPSIRSPRFSDGRKSSSLWSHF